MVLDNLLNFKKSEIIRAIKYIKISASIFGKIIEYYPQALAKKNYECIEAKSILDINIDYLKSRGINSLVIDWEDTLADAKSAEFYSCEIKQFLFDLKNKRGFKISIHTNNYKLRDKITKMCDCSVVNGPYFKPGPNGYGVALETNQSVCKKTASIGDSRLFDGVGTNMLGMQYIHVPHLSHLKKGEWLQRLFRYVDRKLYYNCYEKQNK